MAETILDVRNLVVRFPMRDRVVQATNQISFSIQRGQTVGIVGESGSGKSVTALAVMGLVPPPGQITGEIWLQTNSTALVNLLSLTPEAMRPYRGSQIAMIFQEPQSSLNPIYTCGFQLMEALRQHRALSQSEAKRQACALLQEVKLLASDEALFAQACTEFGQVSDREVYRQVNRLKQAFLDRYPHQLSGGQIQRVMIAMAIASQPALLIADEPTTALDVTVQATILDLLRELRTRHQMSMMFITHDLGLVAEIADRVVVMYQGTIVESGAVEQVFAHPQHPYTKGLLACRPHPAQQRCSLPTIADFMEVITTPTGETLLKEKQQTILDPPSTQLISDSTPLSLPLSQQSALLSVQDLRVGFPVRGVWGQAQRYIMAVNGVSFEIYPGETLGLVGESGCGKTTLARTLLRLIQPIQGQIWFEGRNVGTLGGFSLRQFYRDIQIVFQDPFSALDPRMTIGEAIMEPMVIHSLKPNRQRNRDRAVYLLERVGLQPDSMQRYPHEFSGGQRQRICIARALALSPKLVICDESVSALDVSVQAQVLNLLKELQRDLALTYLFISHDLSVVKFMSDRILVMNAGEVEEVGTAEQIYHHPTQEYTRKLIAAIPTQRLEQIQHQL